MLYSSRSDTGRTSEVAGRAEHWMDMTGVILAGGRSGRFGEDKALAPWCGKTLVEHVVEILKPVFPAVLVVVKARRRFGFLEGGKVRVVTDGYRARHALGGIYTGLLRARTVRAFVVACDMPFINPGVVRALARRCAEYDAVVPVFGGMPQPLCALYSRKCIGTIRHMIAGKRFRIRDLFLHVRTRFVPENVMRKADPRGLSFVDLDTRKDYRSALRMIRCL